MPPREGYSLPTGRANPRQPPGRGRPSRGTPNQKVNTMAKASVKKGAAAPATAPTPAAPVAATAAPAQATPAKAPRPPAVVQNGVTRPRAGGLCAAVWEITEKLAESGEMPSIGQVKAVAAEQGLNPTNVSIEFYRCRQFHGVRGRQPKPQPAQPEA